MIKGFERLIFFKIVKRNINLYRLIIFMEIYFEKENKTITKTIDKSKNNLTVGDILEEYSINPQEVIVIKGKKIVLENVKVSNDDSLKILNVVSGG